MWKYVSRRVKDTLERTCNVLDVGRTSFCSSGAANGDVSCGGAAASPTPSDSQVLVYKKGSGCVTWFRDGCGRFSGKHGNPDEEQAGQERKERERLHYQDGIAQSWLSALTWSSAIVCGWYTSQYMCLRRKRMGWAAVDRPKHQCLYANLLMNTTRSLHTNVTNRMVFAAPASSARIDSEIYPASLGALLQNVNNPVGRRREERESIGTADSLSSQSSSRSRSSRSSSSLDSAVAEFSITIGEIEYQFARQDLGAENYKSAVTHLKLATTHHHPAATFNLGLCYERGLGVERDLKLAMQCYTVASSLGHAKAMFNLGVYYVRGWGGLKRSGKAARQCFASAARLGQPEAQLALDRRSKQIKRRGTGEDRGLEPQLLSAAGKDTGLEVHAF